MNIKKQEIRHVIEKKLELKPRRSKENHVWYTIDNKKILRFTYPKGRGDIHPKTLKIIRRQFELNWDDFIDLVKCPMSAK